MNNEKKINNIAVGAVSIISIFKIISLIITFLIGLFIIFVTTISVIHSITYIETKAVIVDVQYNSKTNSFIPIYEYDYKGKKVQAKGIPLSNRNQIIIGSEQIIQYDPDNYKLFDIGSKKESIIIFLIGSVLLILSSIRLYTIFKT